MDSALNVSNLFPFEVVQKCQSSKLCVLQETRSILLRKVKMVEQSLHLINKNITEHLLFFADDPITSCNSTQEFLCENRICLSRDLTCEQYNNCQDETASDESRNWEVCGRYAKSKSTFKYNFQTCFTRTWDSKSPIDPYPEF